MTEYAGMLPWMTQWWLDHLNTPPAVVIRCGYRAPERSERECRNAIGEVKIDGDHMLAMSKSAHPEVTTDWQPLAAGSPEELDALRSKRDAQVLRYVGPGPGEGSKIVYRRRTWPHNVAPVQLFGSYVCRMHGPVEIDTADLAAFALAAARDTPTVSQTYRAHRAVN